MKQFFLILSLSPRIQNRQNQESQNRLNCIKNIYTYLYMIFFFLKIYLYFRPRKITLHVERSENSANNENEETRRTRAEEPTQREFLMASQRNRLSQRSVRLFISEIIVKADFEPKKRRRKHQEIRVEQDGSQG